MLAVMIPRSARRLGLTRADRLPILVALAVFAASLLVWAASRSFIRPAAGIWPLNSDAWWYAQIARNGFHAEPLRDGFHDFAFMPLYGLLVGLIGGWAPSAELTALAGVALNLPLWLAGAVLWHRRWRATHDRRVADAALLLVALAPAAFVVGSAYSEPLYIALTALCFAPSARSRRLAGSPGAAAAGLLATLARISGLALAAAALLRSGPWPARLARASGPLLACALWFAFAAWLTGRPLGWFDGLPGWLETAGQPRGLIGWFADPAWRLRVEGVGALVSLGAALAGALAAWRAGARPEAAYLLGLIALGGIGGVVPSLERYLWPGLFAVGPYLMSALLARRRLLLISVLLWAGATSSFWATAALGIRNP